MEKQKKRWGDRADACWIRELDGLHVIMPHLMDKRTDADGGSAVHRGKEQRGRGI